MENEAGPIFDMAQFLTMNSSQPAHHIRQPPVSLAFLRQIISISRVAQKWENHYPQSRWQESYTDRRALSTIERFRLRRALYRFWLFSRAFHNPFHLRQFRLQAAAMEERSRLIRNWSTEEIAEIEDFRNIMRIVLQSICSIDDQAEYDIHSSYLRSCHYQVGAPSSIFHSTFSRPMHAATLLTNTLHSGMSTLANFCGSETGQIGQYYVLEDLMKLDPGEVMWLHENTRLNCHIPAHLESMGKGEWFQNNGETFSQTIERVLSDRGEDIQDIRSRIAQGDLGIVTSLKDSLHSIP